MNLKLGMICKHFKGQDLYEKNIYRIVALNKSGKDIDTSIVTYSGDNNLEEATNLIVYENIFQDGKMFAREYADLTAELSEDKKQQYNQKYRVEPLTLEEIKIITTEEFINNKREYVKQKTLTK